jgi:MFS family permease
MVLLRTYLDLSRRNRALARLLVGEFVSSIGDWLYLVAVLVVVYAASDSAVLLGVIGAARIVPYIVLSVPAGMVVDRFDRRTVLLVTDVARGLLMLVLAGLVMAGASVVPIVALAILAACFSTFFGPAISALLPTLVDESDLGPANSAWATLDNVAFIVGPALAGGLIAAGGLSVAFLLNALSFAVVAVILWRLPSTGAPAADEATGVPPPAEEAPAPKAAWGQLWRPLAGPFVLDSATSFVFGGLGVLTVIIAVDVLGAGEAGTGYLNAATGVGGVVAGIGAGALLARQLRVPLLLGGGVAAAGLVFLALAGNLLLAMLAIGVAVAGALLLDVVNTTLIQRIVPDRLRGRAMGTLQMSTAIFYAAGSLLLPVLAATLGMTTVLVGSGVLIAGGVAAALVLADRAAAAAPLDPERARVLELPVFAGLPTPRLEAAARAMEPVQVAAGEAVVREGEPADRFYVIVEGTFAVSQAGGGGGAGAHVRDLGRDDVFGEIGLLRRSRRTATVTATTDGRLLALDGERFLELVSAGPGLSTRLLDLYRGALSQ